MREGSYIIKTFEEADLATLEASVNAYLATLPAIVCAWDYQVTTQYSNYVGNGTPPATTLQTIAITFGDAKKNKHLKYGNKEMEDDNGFFVPHDMHLGLISMSQKDPDDADIEYKVNGVVIETLNVVDEMHTFIVDIPLTTGDVLSAENVSNQDLKNSSFTNFITFDAAGPPPPPPEFKHICVVTVFQVIDV